MNTSTDNDDINAIMLEIRRTYNNIDDNEIRDCLLYYIHFTNGVYALKDLYDFVVLYIQEEQHNFSLLQSFKKRRTHSSNI